MLRAAFASFTVKLGLSPFSASLCFDFFTNAEQGEVWGWWWVSHAAKEALG